MGDAGLVVLDLLLGDAPADQRAGRTAPPAVKGGAMDVPEPHVIAYS
jgi:hypothetical protein